MRDLSLFEAMPVFVESEPMPEYRLIYHWDAEHWTRIATGDIPVDICKYVEKHLEEMRDAAAQTLEEEGIAECFAIEYYYGRTLVRKWCDTPDNIFEVIRKITDDWLSRAFT